MRRLATLFWILAVPSAAGAVAWWLAGQAMADPKRALDASVMACLASGLSGGQGPSGCVLARQELTLILAAAGVIAASFALLLLFRALAWATSWSRLLLAGSFRLASLAAVIAGGLVAAAQILLVAAALFLAWRRSDPTADLTLMAPFALLALVVALLGVFSSLRLFEPVRADVMGFPVGERDQPKLIAMIRGIAERVGARPPDNVILGVEPNFFAMSGQVRVPARAQSLSGDTIYLSMPFLRVLTKGEIAAVIGHELGHFSGKDTAYSRWFAPSYAGLLQAHGDFASGHNLVERLFTYPARMLIADMLIAYDRAIARVDREREKRADQIGVLVSSSEDLACALVKTGVFGALWGFEIRELINRCGIGLATRNLSRNFADSVEYDLKGPELPDMIRKSLESSIPHPSDRHPTTEVRLQLIGFPKDRLADHAYIEQRFFHPQPAAASLDGLDFLEEQLTALYRKRVAPEPSQSPDGFGFSKLLSDFIAVMVVADGVADRREIMLAERRAKAAFKEFDPRDFRERCRHPGELPPIADLVRFAGRHLTAEEAEELTRIMREVAMADGRLHENEAGVLHYVETNLRGSYRPGEAAPQGGASLDAAPEAVPEAGDPARPA